MTTPNIGDVLVCENGHGVADVVAPITLGTTDYVKAIVFRNGESYAGHIRILCPVCTGSVFEAADGKTMMQMLRFVAKDQEIAA